MTIKLEYDTNKDALKIKINTNNHYYIHLNPEQGFHSLPFKGGKKSYRLSRIWVQGQEEGGRAGNCCGCGPPCYFCPPLNPCPPHLFAHLPYPVSSPPPSFPQSFGFPTLPISLPQPLPLACTLHPPHCLCFLCSGPVLQPGSTSPAQPSSSGGSSNWAIETGWSCHAISLRAATKR